MFLISKMAFSGSMLNSVVCNSCLFCFLDTLHVTCHLKKNTSSLRIHSSTTSSVSAAFLSHLGCQRCPGGIGILPESSPIISNPKPSEQQNPSDTFTREFCACFCFVNFMAKLQNRKSQRKNHPHFTSLLRIVKQLNQQQYC